MVYSSIGRALPWCWCVMTSRPRRRLLVRVQLRHPTFTNPTEKFPLDFRLKFANVKKPAANI